MSFLYLLYSLNALVEKLPPFQMDELNKEKTKVVRIRREARLHEMHAIFGVRPNVANRVACLEACNEFQHSKITS